MPYLAHGRPKYRSHRSSCQAIVEIGGKRHYLGPYGSPESHDRYNGVVDAWIAQGRPRRYSPPASTLVAAAELTPRVETKTVELLPATIEVPLSQVPCGQLSVVELVAHFWEFAKERYEKHGRQTGTHGNYRLAIRLLKEQFGELPVADFGPRALKQIQRQLKQQQLSRRYINETIDRVRRVFSVLHGI